MSETLGKRPRKQPTQCWGCKGYNMYIYFPHRSEKVGNVHNVHKFEKLEDMGKNVPKIYATLDNKQDKF
jgi:hypothetical protein